MKKLLILIPLFLLSACTMGTNLSYNGSRKAPKSNVTILDSKSFNSQQQYGLPFSEISDLAYNQKTKKLYMIGDKGFFYIFKAKFGKKIENFEHLKSYKITEKNQKKSYDSEGLTLDNRGQLYISFEKYPRISSIDKKGYLKSNQKLTKALRNRRNYKNSNAIFEALAWHPKYGLLTAAEYPMFKRKNERQTIYSLRGKRWNFKAQKHKKSAVTAIEVMDDGNLLILERSYNGLSQPFIITLKKLYLNNCSKGGECKTKVMAEFNSYEGWDVNNYEGLTKVGKNRYLMVADNNNKSFISTTFIYFKINKDK